MQNSQIALRILYFKLSFSKFSLMRFEKIVICSYVFKLRPLLFRYGNGIEIVDLRALHGKQKGGMRGDHELTAVKARGIREKIRKLTL